VVNLLHFGSRNAYLFHFVGLPVGDEANLHAGFDRAINQAHKHDHPAIHVEPGVKDQRLQRSVMTSLGRRNFPHYGVQHFPNAYTLLGAYEDGVLSIQSDDAFDLLLDAIGFRARKVNLVDYRKL
jgi:hypothetical protein